MKKWVTNKNQYEIFLALSGRSNVYIISNGKNIIIVDTSIKLCRKPLTNRINNMLAKDKKVAALFLTHAHFDHVANAAELKSIYKTKLIIQKEDAKYLTDGDGLLPTGTNKATGALTNMLGKLEGAKSLMKYTPAVPDIVFDNSYDLNSFGFNAYILHTPGHTYGSASVIIDDEIAIVGDTMAGLLKHSIYPPFALNPKLLVKSWSKLIDTGASSFLPSHGGEKSKETVIEQYEKRIKLIE